jgi:anti-sigma factor RsiW
MSEHWSDEAIASWADGETAGDGAHLQECARCAGAALDAVRLKHAVREAVPRFTPPSRLRERIEGKAPRRGWIPLAFAAAVALVVAGLALPLLRARSEGRELADLHATLLGSANPIDVVSTDRHTVKPWFEGRLPFSFPIPDLHPPFRLEGGRVVTWHGRPAAYLLVMKGAHRISLFVTNDDRGFASTPGFATSRWHRNGLSYALVGDVPESDLAELQRAFAAAR